MAVLMNMVMISMAVFVVLAWLKGVVLVVCVVFRHILLQCCTTIRVRYQQFAPSRQHGFGGLPRMQGWEVREVEGSVCGRLVGGGIVVMADQDATMAHRRLLGWSRCYRFSVSPTLTGGMCGNQQLALQHVINRWHTATCNQVFRIEDLIFLPRRQLEHSPQVETIENVSMVTTGFFPTKMIILVGCTSTAHQYDQVA
jgi:hypothetical protein